MGVMPPVTATDRLAKERNIWMVTVRPSGRPHIVPVWFVWVRERVYACIEPESVKARNLEQNQSICLALEEGSHPVICEGRAQTLKKPWPGDVVAAFLEKYAWDISSESQYTLLVEITPLKWMNW